MAYLKMMFAENEVKLIITIFVIIVFHIIRTISVKIINKKVDDVRRRYMVKQVVSYTLLILGMGIIIYTWSAWVRSMLTFLSLVAAAIIISSKEIVTNLLANAIIIMRGLFAVGDRIKIGDFTGDIIETGPVFFTLAEIGSYIDKDEHTGRTIKVPNGMVLSVPLINYTRVNSIIWSEIKVELHVESNWETAMEICDRLTRKHSLTLTDEDKKVIMIKGDEIMFLQDTPRAGIEAEDGKIVINCRFLTKFYKRREVDFHLWQEILKEFKNYDDIKLWAK